jgi:hypothetical protein
MKRRLISAYTVRQAKENGLTEIIYNPLQTMITAEARDVAKDLGLTIREEGRPTDLPGQQLTENERHQAIEQVTEKVLTRLPKERQQREKIIKLVEETLQRYERGR